LDETEFLHPQAAEYYAHKKNLLISSLIEECYEVFLTNKLKTSNDYLCSLPGTLEKIGSAFSINVL